MILEALKALFIGIVVGALLATDFSPIGGPHDPGR